MRYDRMTNDFLELKLRTAYEDKEIFETLLLDEELSSWAERWLKSVVLVDIEHLELELKQRSADV